MNAPVRICVRTGLDGRKPGFMKLMYPPVRHFRILDALLSRGFSVFRFLGVVWTLQYLTTLQRGPAQTKLTGRAKPTFKMDRNSQATDEHSLRWYTCTYSCTYTYVYVLDYGSYVLEYVTRVR